MGIQQGNDYRGPSATDPSMLVKISSPVLLMQGGRSNAHSWFHASMSYVAEHVPRGTVHEFANQGILAPMAASEPVAGKLPVSSTRCISVSRADYIWVLVMGDHVKSWTWDYMLLLIAT